MKATMIYTALSLMLGTGTALAKGESIFVQKQNGRIVQLKKTPKGSCTPVTPTSFGNGRLYSNYMDGNGYETACSDEAYSVATYDLAQLPEADCWELHDVNFTKCTPSGLKDVELNIYSYEITYEPMNKNVKVNVQQRDRYDGIAITNGGSTYTYGGQASIVNSTEALGAGGAQLTGLEVETTNGDHITPYLNYYFYSWPAATVRR